METNIKKIATIDNINFYHDPLRRDNSFMVTDKTGSEDGLAIQKDQGLEIILKSYSTIKGDDVLSIVGGFSDLDIFKKIMNKINEQNK